MVGTVWQVVSRDGVVVRSAKSLASAVIGRVAPGALLEEADLDGSRLRYRRLSGIGPEIGWVSIRSKVKLLLVPATPGTDCRPSKPALLHSAASKWQNTGCSVTGLELSAEKHEGLDRQAPHEGGLSRAGVALPPEACDWDDRERSLWLGTGGRFNPRDALSERSRAGLPAHGRCGRPGHISVISPTMESRQSFHRQLWLCFNAQACQDKELVVVETYRRHPSSFLTEMARRDRRLVYLGFRLDSEADWSIGLKRNICVHLATGQFIAHFDDDDIYAPLYLPTMVKHLTRSSVLAVKLCSWYSFDAETEAYYCCEPLAFERTEARKCSGLILDSDLIVLNKQDDCQLEFTYGFGFSYVYRRNSALEFPFEDVNMGEDFGFYARLLRDKGTYTVALFWDTDGICLHVQHGHNTSHSWFITLRRVSLEEAADLDFSDLLRSNFIAQPFPAGQSHETNGAADGASNSLSPEGVDDHCRRHFRIVSVHTLTGDFTLSNMGNATTAAQLLGEAEKQAGVLQHAEVYRIPPPGQLTQSRLRELAIMVRRIASFGVMLAESLEDPDHEPFPELEHLLSRMDPQERLGSLTKEVWVLFPGDQPTATVRLTCEGPLPPGSVGTTIHVELPRGSNVSSLKRTCRPGICEEAEVFLLQPDGRREVLRGHEAVPKHAFVTGLTCRVTPEMVLTKTQCLELTAMLHSAFRREAMQEKLNELEREAAGRDEAYRAMLGTLLMEEVYPTCARNFGFDAGRAFMSAMSAANIHWQHSIHWEEAHLELEMLMRNTKAIQHARYYIAQLRAWRSQAKQN